jgi:hypothetical protein
VWQEVCALLAHPERLAEEDRRRAHADRQPKPTTLTTLAAQLGKRRQGLARLIDRYTDGRIDKPEFEPRLARLRQRIAHLEAQRQQLAEEAALHTDLRLIIGRLEDLAAQVQEGLAEADWHRQRALSRALVRRVEVAPDHVQVVFRIEPRPGDPSPEKKRLQDCRRSTNGTSGERSRLRRLQHKRASGVYARSVPPVIVSESFNLTVPPRKCRKGSSAPGCLAASVGGLRRGVKENGAICHTPGELQCNASPGSILWAPVQIMWAGCTRQSQ